ncbi:protein of unknown function [Taphrina deformans PYCC 5710]|uniref:Uncharacterized protein n=1 Tax=Taphrina deformans (strain PYCC 5710 / ATCC 11124 / CBS 356.35 / IMI 108563 / JCM 9778 / NBRC 8474) TaxID=1097556 RepID=R4X9J2_TAPDE|nr:protein of unknown function [Taphrina deformans PYCC 5710]|eukprot:CCG82390.1 protein of unknown function [Taphrina deformans PYCC 5710]
MWKMNMYDEYSTNPRTDAPPIIVPYHITLLGRHRQLAVQFRFNTLTQRCTSTKGDDSQTLSGILRHRFGRDAIGVLVGGKAEYYEDELVRSGVVPVEGAHLHVLYDDSAPPYAPPHSDSRTGGGGEGGESVDGADADADATRHFTLPDLDLDLDHGSARRVCGLTYYDTYPLFTARLAVRTADGSTHTLRLDNRGSSLPTDPVAHFLATRAGDRAVAIRLGTREYRDDNLLFDRLLRLSPPPDGAAADADADAGDRVDAVVHVTYRAPSPLNLLQKSLDKRRDVKYSALPEAT